MIFEYFDNIFRVDNYKQIKQIKSDLISLDKINIYGDNLKVLKLDKDEIVIKGIIKKIILGNEI